MPITQIVPHEGGGAWGWDTDVNKWVPVDQQTMQGSLPGNLARAGLRGLQDINLGVNQLAEPNAPDIQARIKVLDLQKGLAKQAAPWTEGIGEALPDVVAGLATAPFTGGMSLPASIALAGAGGATSAFLRPGTLEDRVTNALYGAAAGAAGFGLGEAAVRGVGAGLRVAETITTRNAASVARGVEVGGQRVRNAADRAAAEQAAAEGAGPAAGGPDVTVDSQGNVSPGGGPQPGGMPGGGGAAAEPGIQPGQSTAGAARTPLGEQGTEHATENAAADLTDRTGGNVEMSDAAMAQRQRVEEMGYRSPAWADTRRGSIARFAGGVNERLPWMQLRRQTDMAGNQGLAARSIGEAMGMRDVTTLGSHEFDAAQQNLNHTFENMGRDIPEIDSQSYADVLKTLQQRPGMFSKGEGQREIDGAINRAEAYAGPLDGRQVMQDRSMISDMMADFYKNNKIAQGDLMRQALERIDELVASRAAQQGDTTLLRRWATAREQWQVYTMARKAGAVSQEGDVNPTTMFRAMQRDRRSGGFGPGGPQNEGPARRAFDLMDVMRRDQHGVPPTGVATAAALANMGIQGTAPGLIGMTGYGILNTLLGNR